MIVGLTGGTGCGKSSVGGVFMEHGFEIIDFDKISRDVCLPGTDCLDEICTVFGSEILGKDKSLNRKALGAIVFSDKEKLEILNAITHKYILKESELLLEKSKNENFVFDAPLLFEAKLEKKCDCVVSILSDMEKRAERICRRDSINYEYAIKRIKSQPNDNFYLAKSQYIIYNNNSVDLLIENTLRVIEEIKSKTYLNFSDVKIFGKDV